MDMRGPSKYGPSPRPRKPISKLKLSTYLVSPEYYKGLQETKLAAGPYFREFALFSSHADLLLGLGTVSSIEIQFKCL